MLLLLLALFVLLLFIWGGFAVIISEVYFIGELNAERAPLDPWCLWLQGHCTRTELFEHRVINARYHVRWFDKGKGKTGFHVDACRVSRKSELHICQAIAESLLLWEDCQLDVLPLVQESSRVFLIIDVRPLEIVLSVVRMAEHLLVYQASEQPQLARILFGHGVKNVVELGKGLFEFLLLDKAKHYVVGELMDV